MFCVEVVVSADVPDSSDSFDSSPLLTSFDSSPLLNSFDSSPLLNSFDSSPDDSSESSFDSDVSSKLLKIFLFFQKISCIFELLFHLIIIHLINPNYPQFGNRQIQK